MALFKADDFDEARAAFLVLPRTWPGTEEAHEARYRAAWALFHQGKFEPAEAEFLSISRDPANPWACDALYRSADCLYNRGLHRDAAARYREVLSCPEVSRSLQASANNSIAWCHLESGDRLEAARAFAHVMREYPGTAPWEDSAYKLAELRMEMGDKEGAIEAFTQIASHEVGTLWPNAALELVRLESEEGNHEEALRWVERLEDSSDPALHDEAEKHKAQLLVKLGRHSQAAQVCRGIIEHRETDEMQRFGHHWLGRISWLDRDWAGAEESFSAAARSPASQSDDYLWWAKALVMQERTTDVEALAEKAVSKAPTAAQRRSIPLEIGKTYGDAGMTDDAVREFLKVAILYPTYAEARQALLLAADVYHRTGDDAKARQTLDELVEKHPQSDEAGKARQMLRDLGE